MSPGSWFRGENGTSTQVQTDIDGDFPLILPDWDYNTDGGKGKLLAHCQILMGGPPIGFQAAYKFIQGKDESLKRFLERLMEAHRA